MIRVEEVELKGSKYTITQMTARRSLKMQAKLIKIFGPFLSEIINCLLDLSDVNSSFCKAVQLLSQNIDENSLESIIMELVVGVRKNGYELRKEEIDIEFAGELDTLYRLVLEILKVNYSDFFSEGGIMQAFSPILKNTQQISPNVKKTSLKS